FPLATRCRGTGSSSSDPMYRTTSPWNLMPSVGAMRVVPHPDTAFTIKHNHAIIQLRPHVPGPGPVPTHRPIPFHADEDAIPLRGPHRVGEDLILLAEADEPRVFPEQSPDLPDPQALPPEAEEPIRGLPAPLFFLGPPPLHLLDGPPHHRAIGRD